MGISIAVGTVLGASTLPFYEQPSDHYSNMLIGAAAGAAVGLGILIYEWVRKGPTAQEKFYFDRAEGDPLDPPPLGRPGGRKAPGPRIYRTAGNGTAGFRDHVNRSALRLPRAQILMPLVSLTW